MNNLKYATLLLSIALMVTACAESEAPIPEPALDADAIEANNRGVGLMGRFEYAQALAVFTELLEGRPGWNDARVNLAIATLNRQQDGDELLALDQVRAVLGEDPANLRARYVAGLVHLFLGEPQQALPEFEYVLQADPQDAHAAYYLAQCHSQLSEFDDALTWYRKAIELDPYLRSAYYGAFQSLQRLGRQDEASALAKDYQRLENNPRSQLAEFKYTRMGPKAEALAVGLETEPAPAVPEGELFAAAESLSLENVEGLNWLPAAKMQAPGITTVDLQNDGHPDLFVSGVLELESPGAETLTGNLVLQGREDGVFEAVDGHPLSGVSGVNATLWGDFDNDGLVDVYFCRRGLNQLWRQTTSGYWEDVTASTLTAGEDLDTVDGAFFDADHDGDLDLYLVNANGPDELLNNNLDGTFRPLAADFKLAGSEAESMMVLPADLDNDLDADLIVLKRTPPHEIHINDRLWSYSRAEGFDEFMNTPALAVLAADIDSDGLAELYSIHPDGGLLRWQAGAHGRMESDRLASLQAAANPRLSLVDVNGDGVLDLVASSALGWEVLSLNGDSVDRLYSFAAEPGSSINAFMPLTAGSESGPAMLAFSDSEPGLIMWPPGPGRFPFVTLTLSGRQDDAHSMRSNASGIGAQVAIRTGSRWSLLENYRNHSAPGQSLQPLTIGLGGARKADFVSIEWSDGVFQSEIDIQAGRLTRITETQRQLSSCPVLFAWNGEEYAFVSDFLGVGGMGYSIGPGEYTTPRPWENFLLPEGLLQLKDGRYELKLTEPMEENAYIDAASLTVYDLPPDWQMVMDDRMGILGPQPTGQPRFFRNEQLPVSAVNDRGKDVLETIQAADGAAAPVGELDHRFIGRLAGEHVLTLEFPQALDSYPGAPMLVIDGWVEYPYSQTNFAAWQAGAAYSAPTLEAMVDGEWVVVQEQFGYPAGMPRRMSMPLDNLTESVKMVRIRTNLQIYWDRISIAYAEELPDHEKQALPVAAATLSKTGFARRSTFEQFRPHYDYAELEPFWDTRYMAGYYTRLGPVEELVTKQDDAVAIIGPGEEVHLEFNGAGPGKPGWRRYFVLETRGWAKDMDLFTRDGATVGPLPSTGKPEAERDQLHARYNTRYLSGF